MILVTAFILERVSVIWLSDRWCVECVCLCLAVCKSVYFWQMRQLFTQTWNFVQELQPKSPFFGETQTESTAISFLPLIYNTHYSQQEITLRIHKQMTPINHWTTNNNAPNYQPTTHNSIHNDAMPIWWYPNQWNQYHLHNIIPKRYVYFILQNISNTELFQMVL